VSNASVKKRMSDQILKAASKKEAELMRASAQTNRPQVVYLQDLKWLDDIILEMMDRGHMPKKRFKRYNTPKNLQKARAIARTKQATYLKNNKFNVSQPASVLNTIPGTKLAGDAPEIFALLQKGEAFLVGSFATAGELKKDIIEALVTQKARKAFKDSIKGKVDRGHGAGTGTPISGLSINQASQSIHDLLTPEQQVEFNAYVQKEANGLLKSGQIDNLAHSMIVGCTVDYQTTIDNRGRLRSDYVPVLQYQDKYANRATDGVYEKLAKQAAMDIFNGFTEEEFLNLEGSDSLKTLATKAIVNPLVKSAGKNKSLKVQLDSKSKGSYKPGKGKARSTSKVKGRSSVKQNKKGTAPRLSKTRAKKSFTSNPLHMIAMLNKDLPDTVRKNMQAPALVNRTGRFSESVKVLEVTETSKGFPSIGYTYDNEPYGVFEMGIGAPPWATPERDPRPLIDRSIREVAQQMAIGRFYTRRM